jgi:CheY-like chemotaxis protein
MYRILVIDDDEQVRDVCQRLLEENGFEVAVAPDGIVGLEVFDRRPSDLVICDIYMPNKDGIETIQELTRTYFDVKVIAISGGAPGLPDYLTSARLFGAVEVLPKPFTSAQLLTLVRDLLDVRTVLTARWPYFRRYCRANMIVA